MTKFESDERKEKNSTSLVFPINLNPAPIFVTRVMVNGAVPVFLMVFYGMRNRQIVLRRGTK